MKDEQTTSPKATILVIDDTHANLRLLSELLEKQGYGVRPVSDGNLALTSARTSSPDLILLDIMLSGLSGYEVCTRLKTDEQTRDIPVIFMSILNDATDLAEAFSVGGVDYITLPFRPEEVLARVKTHLTLRNVQKQFQEKNSVLLHEMAEHKKTEAKLLTVSEELKNTLEMLQKTQKYVTESEKMVVLGQLVAGIIHELNTPIAVIHSSIDHISLSFTRLLIQLPEFFSGLSEERQQDFLILFEHALQSDLAINTREKRRLRKTLISKLEIYHIEDARKISNLLVDIGIHDDIEVFLPLLQDPEHMNLLEMVTGLAGFQKSTKSLTTASDQAFKFVSSLKTYARYDLSGKPALADLTKGIEIALMLCHNQIKRGVEVFRNYDELPLIRCYPDELNQVWTNLIHNALQAMNNDGTLTINVTTRQKQVVVAISDTGEGIPDEIKENIFEPFFTTKPAGVGSGLGLDIVKKIVTKHQGTITFESQPGKTTFWVMLPMIME